MGSASRCHEARHSRMPPATCLACRDPTPLCPTQSSIEPVHEVDPGFDLPRHPCLLPRKPPPQPAGP
eukprot:scaffold25565_cov129-Isochrysis_galbana.AAC.1